MLTLADRLLQSETEFLSAVLEGGDALSVFELSWEKLLEDIDAAHRTQQLDEETATLAHVTSLRLAALADTSADLYTSYNHYTSQLMDDLTGIMSELSLDCPKSSPSSPVASSSSPGPSTQQSSRKRRCVSSSTRSSRKRSRVYSCSDASGDEVWNHYERSGPVRHPTLEATTPLLVSETFKSSVDAIAPSTKHQSRKRRLSDADTRTPPLYAKRRFAGPRLHAVSDSFVTLHIPWDDPSATIPRNDLALRSTTVTWYTPPTLPASPKDLVSSTVHEDSTNDLEISATCFEETMSSHSNDLDSFLESLLASSPSPIAPASPSDASADDSRFVLEDILTFDPEPELSDGSGSVASTPSPRSPIITPMSNPSTYPFDNSLLTDLLPFPCSSSPHKGMCYESNTEGLEIEQFRCESPGYTLLKPLDTLPSLDWNALLERSTWLSISLSPYVPHSDPAYICL